MMLPIEKAGRRFNEMKKILTNILTSLSEELLELTLDGKSYNLSIKELCEDKLIMTNTNIHDQRNFEEKELITIAIIQGRVVCEGNNTMLTSYIARSVYYECYITECEKYVEALNNLNTEINADRERCTLIKKLRNVGSDCV